MKTAVDEIAEGIYRICSYLPDASPEGGFTFNQFLLDAEEPLLFHCGPRLLFPDIAEAAERIMELDRLQWISFGHFESDECGSMNRWLRVAPESTLIVGAVTAEVNVADLADRAPQVWADGEVLDIGGKRIRRIDTPHVLHGWDAGLLWDETTETLLCGDLFTHTGGGPPVRDDDVVERAFAAEDLFKSTALTPSTASTIRKLAELAPATLALMHGSAFTGDCVEALVALADGYEARLLERMD
ncbi:MAG TPA: MBL fold metallo-hydrolase [Acidimicrobiales bacterium]|jgi:flavorubredoxin|nr:MBL fold metallo-hydrolase [Acidimicrobiales bacterium]